MKRTLSLFLVLALCLALLLCLFPAFASADESGKCGDNLYWSFNSSNGALTITGSGAMSYESNPWYDLRDQITSIVLPNGLTSICDYAFLDCPGLTSVTIPASVEWIGEDAFAYSGLTSLTLLGSTHLNMEAFFYCSDLRSVTFPCGARNGGLNTFEGCRSIEEIHLTKGTGTMDVPFDEMLMCAYTAWSEEGEPVFVTPPALNVIIDEGVETISEGGFGAAVTHLSLPASVTTIKNDAFPQGLQTVTYGGTEAQRAAISIEDGNEGLENATWYYMPEITTQPTDTTVNEGATATLTAVATGGGLSYKWQYQKPGSSTWTDVSNNGASATYTLTTAARHNGYKYRCKVTNAAGSVYTNSVTLTVTTAAKPTITTQPKSVTVNEGAKATFQVVATGATGYKWQYQKPGSSTWTDVSNNGTSDTYSLTTAARHNGYKYRCKVTNAAGTVTSSTATLTIGAKPTITTQPKSVIVNAGAKATFKVVATGATSYKWQYQKPGSSTWTDVSNNGASATYTLTTAARHNGYKYRCKVTNAAGSVYTNSVTLTVTTAAKPAITTQPKGVTVNAGAKATFKVVATGATGYKWQYQKPGSSTWTDVSNNGTSATYSLTTAARHNGYKYRCKVTNSAGTVYTSAVKLTVK